MKFTKIGEKGPSLSQLGLGGAPFGREIDEETSRMILDYALEKEITLLDTAESYGGGNAQEYRREVYGVDDVREKSGEMHSSEKIIGRWLRDRQNRDSVVLCTKFSTGGSPENVARAVRDSLERLQTDFIDIYMMHAPDPKVPIEETLDALNKEVEAGRIGTIGCSNFSQKQLEESILISERRGYARMQSTQPPFSLANAGARLELLPYCQEEQIASITYSPLAAGFLAGKYLSPDGQIPKGTRFDVIPGHSDVYFHEHNFRIVEQLRELADKTGLSMVFLAMAWATGHPLVTTVLIGARKFSHLDNALETIDHPLDNEIRETMDAWLENVPA